jgi:hypothetical protein
MPRRDRPTSHYTPTYSPSGDWTIAQRAVERLQTRYPSELELRPIHFNGRDQRVRSRLDGYGAARNKFERFMDRQKYWDWSWMRTSSDGAQEWKTRAPFVKPVYPASVFQGRKKVEHERQRCQHCNASFMPKRKDAKFCTLGCKQTAYRRRQGRGGW